MAAPSPAFLAPDSIAGSFFPLGRICARRRRKHSVRRCESDCSHGTHPKVHGLPMPPTNPSRSAPPASALSSADQPISLRSRPTDTLSRALLTAVIAIVAALLVHRSVAPVVRDLLAWRSAPAWVWLLDVCGLCAIGYFLSTLWLALRYRAVPAPAFHALPSVSVVVPAYNEGAMVRVAIRSALESRYPSDRLSVIAVDDGSTDDTWEHIAAMAASSNGRVTAVRLPLNGGKREALRAGFLRAQGEMIVTVDSDSRLEANALRHAVAPLVADPSVAAVAGKVLVLNRRANMLSRMLAARFFVTFDLTRAAQSHFGSVLCCPGALTAYRRSAVLEVLDRWSAQTFLGSPCTIGEDRALTTWLLRSGYRAVYQGSSVVHTLVPTTLRDLARMLVRWERGNVRESIVMLPVLLTPWRAQNRWWPTFEIVFDLVQYPLGYLGLAMLTARLAQHPGGLGAVLACLLVGALVQSLYCLRSDRGTDFLYGLGYACFALVGLQWIFPYSCVTLHNGRWLTR